MKERISVYEDGALSFITFSDKDTHDHYTSMAVADGKIYLVGTTAGESEIAVYDMTGERIGSIPVPPETNVGAYALYEENDSLMLLSHDLKCFRLENGSFVGENGFTVDDPRNINGRIKVSFNGTDIMIDAGDCIALGVYRIVKDRVFCIGY